MKNGCLLLITYCLFLLEVNAQERESRWLVGTGITYCSYINSPGINLNITYRVIGNFHVGPDFSALLNHEISENGSTDIRKELEYNFNGQYLFYINRKLALYPIAGINWSNITNHVYGQEPVTMLTTALNLGTGLELEIGKVRLFFESKWVSKLNKYDLTTGILVPL